MQGAHEAGVRVISGLKVTAVDVEKTAIVLEDGARISADLIIGADGVHVGSQNTTWHLCDCEHCLQLPIPSL